MEIRGVQQLADALLENKVNIVLSLWLLIWPFMQTLTKLSLFETGINDAGCEYLAGGLRNNTVILFSSWYFLFTLAFFVKTLAQLDITYNRIRFKGAQHLAEGLRDNTVNFFVCSYLAFLYWPFRNRVSLHSISITTKLASKALKLWPMLYERTRWVVSFVSWFDFSYLWPFHVDSYETWTGFQLYWYQRSSLLGWCFTK